MTVAGCNGAIGPGAPPDAGGPPPPPNTQLAVGRAGLRRLSRDEYANTLRDLVGIDTRGATAALPDDQLVPFDNDFTTQRPSDVLVEGAQDLAERVAARALADPARRAYIVGCTPRAPDDAECMRHFIATFGRRVLRRALAPDEVEQLRALQSYAVEAGDFYAGVAVIVRALLQDLEFLYRAEVGAPVAGRPGLYRLDSWEIATRLSYLIWGSTPDDALLDLAERDALRDPAAARDAATRMLADPRARAHVERFHALWLGYDRLPQPPDLAAAMQRETSALVDRVVFDQRGSWLELFRADQTYVDASLATLYGLAPPPGTDPAWVSYGATGRRGILSHGAFLSAGAKFGDTSPTVRGLVVRTRLMCQDVPSPPAMVDVNNPPAPASSSRCKAARYAAHATNGQCASCHHQLDPIGFGLENFDAQGRYRTQEPNAPECAIDGQGELAGVGTFHGPAELAELLIRSNTLSGCAVTQLYRYAMGHREGDSDAPLVTTLATRFAAGDYHFDQLVLDLVSSEAFAYRMDE